MIFTYMLVQMARDRSSKNKTSKGNKTKSKKTKRTAPDDDDDSVGSVHAVEQLLAAEESQFNFGDLKIGDSADEASV